MKIGIVTLWRATTNYGQLLQAYALQAYLKELGHTPFLIRYSPRDNGILSKFKIDNLKRIFLSKIIPNLSIPQILYLLSKKKKEDDKYIAELRQREIISTEKKQFSKFRDKHMSLSDTEFFNMYELQKNPPEADAYICGSDQIWSGTFLANQTGGWFLDFGRSDVLRIAYAASVTCGLKSFDYKYKKEYNRLLLQFNAIGVREHYLVDMCKAVGCDNAVHVLDPTLLLSKQTYLSLCDGINLNNKSPYIFLYLLNISSKEEIYWDNINKYVSYRELDVKVTYASGYIPARDILPGYSDLVATIPEWISYLNNAEAVITTSFHGLVFCIKMNKPFLIPLLNNEYAKSNVRMVSLLKSLGLEDRILDPSISTTEQMEHTINWEKVNRKLEIMREKSEAFLKSALSIKKI